MVRADSHRRLRAHRLLWRHLGPARSRTAPLGLLLL